MALVAKVESVEKVSDFSTWLPLRHMSILYESRDPHFGRKKKENRIIATE